MQISDRVVICEARHPLYNLEGTLIGFRGARGDNDTWLLIYVDKRGRSFLIPQSMVKAVLVPDEGGGGPFDSGNGQARWN